MSYRELLYVTTPSLRDIDAELDAAKKEYDSRYPNLPAAGTAYALGLASMGWAKEREALKKAQARVAALEGELAEATR